MGYGLESWDGRGGRARAREMLCSLGHMSILVLVVRSGSSALSCRGLWMFLPVKFLVGVISCSILFLFSRLAEFC